MKQSNFTIQRTKIAKTFLIDLQNNPEPNFKILAKKIRMSIKNTKRLYKSWKEDDKSFFFHKNANKTIKNKIDSKVCDAIVNEFVDLNIKMITRIGEKYKGTEHKTFYDACNIKQKYAVSYSTVNLLLNKNLLPSSTCNFKTRKIINIAKKNSPNKPDLQKAVLEQILLNLKYDNAKAYKGKVGYFGSCVELDACEHRWFNNKPCNIYAAIDSFTGKLLAIHCEEGETTQGYYWLCKRVFEHYGIPKCIKTDQRITFYKTVNKRTPLTTCLTNLGIEVKSSKEPTFKPNVERSFRTMQSRFLTYFAIKGINSIEDLMNNYDDVINFYNALIKKRTCEQNGFRKFDLDKFNQAMVRYEERTIRNNVNAIHIRNESWGIFDKNGSRITLNKHGNIRVYWTFEDDRLFVRRGTEKIYLKKLEDVEVDINTENQINIKQDNTIYKLENTLTRIKKENINLKIKIKELYRKIYDYSN